MIKVRILATGEVVEKTPNEAFGLIDSHKAVRADMPMAKETPAKIETMSEYPTRQMRPPERESFEQGKIAKKKKGYKVRKI